VPAGDDRGFPDSFSARLTRLDDSLYAAIASESTLWDRRSLLACQAAVRARQWPYVYLEIGSHLGGSLQPHILDPACAIAHSIDPRPGVQPDARGARFAYPGNSTARMRENLGRVGDIGRLRCYERTSSAIDPGSIVPKPHLCFIDGEHTDDAVRADFTLCRQVVVSPGLVLFHDAQVVYNALSQIVDELDRARVPFRAATLPDSIFALELGEMGLLDSPELAPLRRESFRGYLTSLRSTDANRQAANRWPFRAYRRLRALFRT
jgi:hypothetical protein